MLFLNYYYFFKSKVKAPICDGYKLYIKKINMNHKNLSCVPHIM